jgi:hypothetical protein
MQPHYAHAPHPVWLPLQRLCGRPQWPTVEVPLWVGRERMALMKVEFEWRAHGLNGFDVSLTAEGLGLVNADP